LATDSPHNGLAPSNILAMLGAHEQIKTSNIVFIKVVALDPDKIEY